MAKKQQLLKDLWLSAIPGHLSPWQQAKALALREVNMELHGGKVHLSWICARLTKGGGGHTQKGSLHEFFHTADSDPEWFPGKHSGAKRGPRPLLTRRKRQCMAASAMAAKKHRRQEPCVATVVKSCPQASMNESTGKPFCAKTIRKVFLEDCYDFVPEHPWKFQRRLQKAALPDSVKRHRLEMAEHLLHDGQNGSFTDNVSLSAEHFCVFRCL